MKISLYILALFLVTTACTSIKKQKICSHPALKNPPTHSQITNSNLDRLLASTHRPMQNCYEKFRSRSGMNEFNTCMVVEVNNEGVQEYYDFWSEDVEFDRAFYECARKATEVLQLEKLGKNFILVQSYEFNTTDRL